MSGGYRSIANSSNIYLGTGILIPALIGSFTLNANWEKNWGYNWIFEKYGDEQRCPHIGARGNPEPWLIFIGAFFHNMYDIGLEEGVGTTSSTNWGLVNQVFPLGDMSPPHFPQYYELHEKHHLRAGSLQKVLAGEAWSKDGYDYPIPDSRSEFGSYPEE